MPPGGWKQPGEAGQKSGANRENSCPEAQDEGKNLYLRFLMATDFISGMTDSYAKDLYQQINGIR